MAMIPIRKRKAGGASGHDDGTGRPWSVEWPEDGAVVEVPYAVALELLRNPEWGFSEAGEDDAESERDGEDDSGSTVVKEPAPTGEEFSESPAARKPAAKAAKKAAAPGSPPAKE